MFPSKMCLPFHFIDLVKKKFVIKSINDPNSQSFADQQSGLALYDDEIDVILVTINCSESSIYIYHPHRWPFKF